MSTELICFSLLGIAALLLNAGLASQALPFFWLVIPLAVKIFLDTNKRREMHKSMKKKQTLESDPTLHT